MRKNSIWRKIQVIVMYSSGREFWSVLGCLVYAFFSFFTFFTFFSFILFCFVLVRFSKRSHSDTHPAGVHRFSVHWQFVCGQFPTLSMHQICGGDFIVIFESSFLFLFLRSGIFDPNFQQGFGRWKKSQNRGKKKAGHAASMSYGYRGRQTRGDRWKMGTTRTRVVQGWVRVSCAYYWVFFFRNSADFSEFTGINEFCDICEFPDIYFWTPCLIFMNYLIYMNFLPDIYKFSDIYEFSDIY